MGNTIELIGYHATHIKNKDSILKNGFKISIKEYEWLGHGVYFFEDIDRAKHWGSNTKYCKNNPIIFKCLLKTNKKQYCDFDVLDNYEKLQNFFSQILNLIKNEKKKIKNAEQHEVMCLAINLFCKEHNFNMVSFTFDDKRYNINSFKLYNSKSKQICVRKSKYIKIGEVICCDKHRHYIKRG